MELTIFADDVYGFDEPDIFKSLPEVKGWGGKCVDFRGAYGPNYGGIEKKSIDEIKAMKKRCDELGLKVGCLQSSLAKMHLSDEDARNGEMKKLEWLIQVCEVFGCRHMRSFNYWQPGTDDKGLGTMTPGSDTLNKIVNMYEPLAKRAQQAGLIISFENCDQTLAEVEAFVGALNIKGWGCAFDPRKGERGNDIMPKTREELDSYVEKGLKIASMFHVKCDTILHEIPGNCIFPWDSMIAWAKKSGTIEYCSIENGNPKGSPLSQYEAQKRTHKALQRSGLS